MPIKQKKVEKSIGIMKNIFMKFCNIEIMEFCYSGILLYCIKNPKKPNGLFSVFNGLFWVFILEKLNREDFSVLNR